MTKTVVFDILSVDRFFGVIYLRIILFLIGLALSLDGLYCGYTGSMGLGEAIVVGSGVMCLVWSSFYDAFKTKGFLKFLKGLFSVFMIILIIYSCAICFIGRMDNDSTREDYAIVLGSGLVHDEPSEILASRLETTVNYLNGNIHATAIVTGGRDKGSHITEAHAMSNYLLARGISSDRVLLEENATSTYENFAYSRDAVNDGSVVLITSEFHVLRSALMASLNGIDATHIGAPTPLYLIPPCCARELIAQISAIRFYLPF